MRPLKVGIHLDDLFDTRISTMLSIDLTKGTHVIAHGYGKRRGDWVIWEGMGITEEKWRKTYRARDSEILTKSVRTKILGVLKEMIQGAEQGPRIQATELNMSLVVNEYPYRLANNVRVSLERLLRRFLHPLLKVNWIRQSPVQMTPARVGQDYTHYFDYDLIPWLELHIETDEATNLLNTELIGPALFQDKPTTEDFAIYKGKLDDIHQLSEQYVSPSWTIRFIPVELFNTPF